MSTSQIITIPTVKTLVSYGLSYSSAIFNSLISPVKNISSHFFPFIEAVFTYNRIRLDYESDKYLSTDSKKKLTNMVKEIKSLANLDKKINIYTKMGTPYSSRGGIFSITSPIIYMPFEELTSDSGLPELKFNKEEKEFLLAKYILQIKNNYEVPFGLYKMVIGSAFCYLFYLTPYIMLSASMIALMGWGFFDGLVENKLNEKAYHLITKKCGSCKKAAKIISNTFKKTLKQNIYYKNNSYLGQFYINKQGENRFNNLFGPTLTSKIKYFESLV